jgi:hypothetical protein
LNNFFAENTVREKCGQKWVLAAFWANFFSQNHPVALVVA